MFRYRCPHCSQLLQAQEIRAGKTTVCSKCSQPLTIPAEKAKWLNERGESLLAASTVVIPNCPPEYVGASNDSENDVLGAILSGNEDVRELRGQTDLHLEFMTPPSVGSQAKTESRSTAAVESKPYTSETTHRRPEPIAVSQPTPTPPPRRDPDPSDEERRRRLVVSRPAPAQRNPETRTNGMAAVTPPPKGREQGAVSFEEPLQLRSQLDIADELAGRLTSRMKPPPEPPRDIRPTTAIWMIGTGIGVALLLAALLTSNDFLPVVAAIGVAQIVFGALWIVWMAYQRDPKRGLLALLPPVNLWFMTRWKYAKYRPLRFAVTGALLLIAARASGYAIPVTRSWAGTTGRTPSAVIDNDLSTQPKLVQLRAYRDQPDIPKLIGLLEELTKTDELKSEDARDRVQLARDLKGLTTHRDSWVRVRALEAFTRWGGDEARSVCLKFLESPNQNERVAAIQLLPRWKDSESARAIAAQLGRNTDETTAAINSLREIGGTLAEEALIPQLEVDDPRVRLLVMDLLASNEIGGTIALAKLRQLADNPPPTSKAFDDRGTRDEAARKAKLLAERLRK